MEILPQQIKIYNSLTATKEVFEPINKGRVGMYVCGPTVYSNVHLGNCRTFISFDMIFRYFNHLGYKVRYVRNITDAGHLENDAEDGEDKIAKKARLEQIEPMEVAQQYTVDFHNVLTQLNLLPPSIEPVATGHIIEQIEMIKKIIKRGFAYVSNGSVYFDINTFNKQYSYGKLSGRKLEDMIANTRELSAQTDKKNPQDFALWKKAESQHIMRWASPWGDGFPGWHLECTAMGVKYLGEKFDIHGGGMDLKFPHHECEIAQSEACNDVMPVNYWMHANMLTLNGKKMSKSIGNNIFPNEIFSGNNNILTKAFTPSVVRFFIMQAHYRSILDFSNDALIASEKGFIKLMEAVTLLQQLTANTNGTSSFDVTVWKKKCYDAMNDDFNTPVLIAHLFDAVKQIHSIKKDNSVMNEKDIALMQKTMSAFVFDVLGLQLEERKEDVKNSRKLKEVIELLIKLRADARINKDFATSDNIREALSEIGIELQDGKDKTTFSIS